MLLIFKYLGIVQNITQLMTFELILLHSECSAYDIISASWCGTCSILTNVLYAALHVFSTVLGYDALNRISLNWLAVFLTHTVCAGVLVYLWYQFPSVAVNGFHYDCEIVQSFIAFNFGLPDIECMILG